MNGPAQPAHDIEMSKITFLIADDKPFFRDMVHTALTRAGAREVKHAVTVEKAKEVLARFGQQIGCVISDWDMAPVGGLDLLRLIRGKGLPKTSPRTPVVILTARADAAAVKAAMAMDVNGFAVAPLSFEKLVKTITLALSRTWTLQPPAHYAGVPIVKSSHAAQADAYVSPKDLYRRPEDDKAPAANPRDTPGPQAPGSASRRSEGELDNVRMCVLARVKPGNIVARDIKDREGHLMLKAGTELPPNMIARLKDLADGHDDSYHVWVGDRSKA